MWDFNFADYLSVVGFIVAIWQIRRAASISQETQRALRSASTAAAKYAILLAAAQADKCEAQLAAAILQNERAQAFERLQEWRKIASDLKGLLRDWHLNRAEAEAALTESIRLAVQAQKRLKKLGESEAISGHLERVGEAMSLAADPVSSIAAQLRTDLDTEQETTSTNSSSWWNMIKQRWQKRT